MGLKCSRHCSEIALWTKVLMLKSWVAGTIVAHSPSVWVTACSNPSQVLAAKRSARVAPEVLMLNSDMVFCAKKGHVSISTFQNSANLNPNPLDNKERWRPPDGWSSPHPVVYISFDSDTDIQLINGALLSPGRVSIVKTSRYIVLWLEVSEALTLM